MPNHRTAICAVLLGIACAVASCGRDRAADRRAASRGGAASDSARIRLPMMDVLARNTPSLLAIRGVTGTGGGNYPGGDSVLTVYVSPDIAREDRTRIPSRLEGYRVIVQETRAPAAPTR